MSIGNLEKRESDDKRGHKGDDSELVEERTFLRGSVPFIESRRSWRSDTLKGWNEPWPLLKMKIFQVRDPSHLLS